MPSVQCCFIYIHYPDISTGFQVFLKAFYAAKGRHHGRLQMYPWVQVYKCLQDLRTRGSCIEILQKKRLVWRFSCCNQKRWVQQLFSSKINPFSQEISRLFLQTPVFDSSNNLLINNKEAFFGKDYNQADFALPKSMRAFAIDFQDIPARLNILF